jgi:flagellin-like hook-associated protein FlgL
MNILKKVFLSGLFILVSMLAFSENNSLNFLNRILSGDEGQVGKDMNRLSGGKILLPDDPANYVIYEKMEAHIRGFGKEIINNGDMISYYKVEDAVLGYIVGLLQRIRELVLQKTDGILSDSDFEIIDTEIDQLYDEIVYTLNQAEFNKKKMFGDLLSDKEVKKVIDGNISYTLENVDRLIDFIVKQRTFAGTKINSLEYSIKGKSFAQENTQIMQSHGDTDYANELSTLKRNQILMLSNVLMLRFKKNPD